MEACDKYAEKYKHEKYDDGFRNTQIIFLPVVFSTFGSLNEEGLLFMKDLFRRNCDSLGKQRCTHMPLLYQQLSVTLQNENFKMMSRRFKLPHEVLITTNSTMDLIPEIIQKEIVQDKLQTLECQKQDLESLLKESLEESNKIFENLSTSSKISQKDDTQEEEYVISAVYINPIIEENTNSDLALEEEAEKQKSSKKEDSYPEHTSFPKRGDKVNVKYSDGWYTGRVDDISSKKSHFWVKFKNSEDLFKVRRNEKFYII